jgi:hypothetical protein
MKYFRNLIFYTYNLLNGLFLKYKERIMLRKKREYCGIIMKISSERLSKKPF